MSDLKKPSNGNWPFRLNSLNCALAIALAGGMSCNVQAAPATPLGGPVKLNQGSPIAVKSQDVELNKQGRGVVLWQEQLSDGHYATYFRRFDRFGKLASQQTHAVAGTLLPTQLLKVFDNGEFAVESRQGKTAKIVVRDGNGGVARHLKDIACKTSACKFVMDDTGKLVVADVATLSGKSRAVSSYWMLPAR